LKWEGLVMFFWLRDLGMKKTLKRIAKQSPPKIIHIILTNEMTMVGYVRQVIHETVVVDEVDEFRRQLGTVTIRIMEILSITENHLPTDQEYLEACLELGSPDIGSDDDDNNIEIL